MKNLQPQMTKADFGKLSQCFLKLPCIGANQYYILPIYWLT